MSVFEEHKDVKLIPYKQQPKRPKLEPGTDPVLFLFKLLILMVGK
ncbi:hypothetical protein P59_034 [Bacillus phage P59]|nr:hypothetical protein P59_034 [Bacillus phage P59]